MDKVEFDSFAENYDNILGEQLSFFEPNTDYFAEYKVKITRDIVKGRPERILEFGCGTGRNLPFLHALFPAAEIYGCDVSQNSLDLAAANNDFACLFKFGFEDVALKYTCYFDLIFVACVFHHIPPQLRRDYMRLMNKLLKKIGEIVIFEHNPHNPITLHMVKTCPFDSDAVLVRPGEMKLLLLNSGFKTTRAKFALFFPAFLRKLRPLEKKISLIPLGGQYFVHGTKA